MYGTYGWHRVYTFKMEYVKHCSSDNHLTIDLGHINQVSNMMELQKLVGDFKTFLLIDHIVDKNRSEFHSDSDDLLVFLKLQYAFV
jgi:hypothetical protein